jgi:hypothetical protein
MSVIQEPMPSAANKHGFYLVHLTWENKGTNRNDPEALRESLAQEELPIEDFLSILPLGDAAYEIVVSNKALPTLIVKGIYYVDPCYDPSLPRGKVAHTKGVVSAMKTMEEQFHERYKMIRFIASPLVKEIYDEYKDMFGVNGTVRYYFNF